ncbi:chromatin remodeling complex Adenosinetriphosphatase [Saitoella coloradoensis]
MARGRNTKAAQAEEDVDMEDVKHNVDEADYNENESTGEEDGNTQKTGAKRKQAMADQKSKLDKEKIRDSAKRFQYLLGQTDLFRHFINIRAEQDEEFMAILEETDKLNSSDKKKKAVKKDDRRHRKSEKEEDAELLQENVEEEGEEQTVFTESPSYIHGQMRDYQVQGLNWLVSLHENHLNGILADEMGLGKTLQTISFLGYLRYLKGVKGPHLVMTPKSTLDNWAREFKMWTPDVNTVVIQGTKDERADLIENTLLTGDFDVCIASYEIVLKEKTQFKKFAWEYIIVDEAHRIKNEESMLSQVIRLFTSRNRLLITGTPLQNNLHELWALLNFLLPDVFSDSQAFDSWFEQQEGDQDTVVQQLHKVLRPFLLRRVKNDVEKSLLPKIETNLYVGLSEMQVKWYQRILEKDIDAVNGAVGKKEGKTRLLNIVMQLRKCCNHPYLFDGAEPGPPFTTDEHLVENSGKMVILDKLLKRKQAQGSRVLIFSQMSRVLDILEDYCFLRDYKYCRIDGSTAHEDRIAAIDDYNRPDSDKFIFLLTTRAGGLGITLNTADNVVLFDSDWNPQADLQAMDRAHRIGQKKQVYVYRFVTENSVEEKVLERAAHKLRLDQLVIQQQRTSAKTNNNASKDDLLGMIQHGAESVFNKRDGGTMTEDDLDAILAKGQDRTKELNDKYAKLGVTDLENFTFDSAYEWNGTDYQKKSTGLGLAWINPSKRERKEQNYSMDGYYKGVLKTGGRVAGQPKAPRAPKQVNVQDHQFYPTRLTELQNKETAYYRKEQEYKVPLADGPDDDFDKRVKEQEDAQREIDEAEPLTEEEVAEKEELSTQGFGTWSRRDFQHFIRANERYGRENIKAIAMEIEGKSVEEVEGYAKVFWDRYTELAGHERFITQIEEGESRLKKQSKQQQLLRKKIEMYRAPLQQLKLIYAQNKGKIYTEDEDRFLLVMLDKYGLDREDIHEIIREEIRESPLFRFDWFFKSRSVDEIKRRCSTLLLVVMKEMDGSSKDKRAVEEEEEEEGQGQPPAKKAKGAAEKKGATSAVKKAGVSRASSVSSTSTGTKGRGRPRKSVS